MPYKRHWAVINEETEIALKVFDTEIEALTAEVDYKEKGFKVHVEEW